MTQLSISGLIDLPLLEHAGAVISIHDPGEGRPQELGGLKLPMLDLVFHDTEDDGDALDHLPGLCCLNWRHGRLRAGVV